MLIVSFCFILLFRTLLANNCYNDEVFYNDSCFKLIQLTPLNSHNHCLNLTSNQCIEALQSVISRLNKIYINNLKLNKDYQFGFLDHKANKKLWNKLISNYSNKSKSFNIFLNYYYYNNNYYIENQPNDDEHPNVMMHGSSTGIKCISGQKIHHSNESFSFFYDNCTKELPFICVKPYDTNFYSQDYETNDRCSTYDKIEPGGNWFECDKLRDAFNESSIKLSKSHKCCMYNIKWKENFYDANKLCYKFDSVVFSLRLKGYKLILEKYADFLIANYLDTKSYKQDKDFFSFWTSCNSKILDPDALDRTNSKFECVQQDSLTNELTSSILENKDIKGIKISALNIKSDQLVKNYYNLTFLNLFFKKLKSNSLDELKIVMCNNQAYVTFPNETINRNREIYLTTCLNDILNTFDLNAVFLARRPLLTYSIETKTVYSIQSNFNNTNCFQYFEQNEKIYLSIPILSICYHFTIFKLDTQISDLSLVNYYRNLNYALEPNYDIELFDLDQEINSIILNTIGIAEFISCNESFNLNNSIYISKYLCYNLISLIKFSNKNDNYLFHLTNHLINSKLVIVLHSYSYIKTLLKLSCNDKASNLVDLIKKCSKFNTDKSCVIKCPKNCTYSNDVWQSKSNPFVYFNQSSICLAAMHSNSLNDYHETHLFWFTKKLNLNEFVIKQNSIYTNIWPPIYLLNLSQNKINLENSFYFNDSKLKNEKIEPSEKEILVLVKSIYSSSETKINPIIFYSDEIESIEIRSIIKLNKIDFELNNYDFKSRILNLKSLHLNDYYELINSRISVKFPISFNESNPIQNENTIRLFNSDKLIKTLKISSKSSKLKCNWYFNNLNSGLNCLNDLNLNLNASNIKDFYNELNIIYPNFESKAFTRVILVNQINSTCKNGGILLENRQKCECLPGFGGNNCEKICNESYFGKNCDYRCPDSSCKKYLICNKDPIGCSCASGYKGYACDQMCDLTSWGPNCIFKCINCTNNCNIFTGECNKCTDGFYGLNCDKKCAYNCMECDQLNGTCIVFKNKTKTTECSFDHVISCNIETNDYKIKEIKSNNLPSLSLLCILKHENTSFKCDKVFNRVCLSNASFNYEFSSSKSESNEDRNSCIPNKEYFSNITVLNEMCARLAQAKQNEIWTGYLTKYFNCNECSNIAECNQEMDSELDQKETSFKIIVMWLITFIIIILIAFIFRLLNRSYLGDYKLLENITYFDQLKH